MHCKFKKMLKFYLTIIGLNVAFVGITQTCKFQGKLMDKQSKEAIIGATVVLNGSNLGAVSDYNGHFQLDGIPKGIHELSINYVGYKKINRVIDFNTTTLVSEDFELEEESMILGDVVVVGKVNKQNAISISMLQQKSPGMITGISNDDIKKAPDKSTIDVLKRVSGASIEDQKFVIIRGLADRYNNAQLNGNLLPSTEPDKRAFSFDLFPSSVLSNLVIFKTATPDLPGEFAGGIIQVNTKEVSEEPFFEVSMGSSYNSQSTFRAFPFYKGSTNDWMGFDNSFRTLDSRVTKSGLSDPATRFTVSKYVPNDWIVESNPSMMPSQSFQLAGGRNFKISENRLGIIGSLSYQNTNKFLQIERNDFNIDKTQIYSYTDNQYKKQYNHGGMLNATYSINSKNKISFNNLATISGSDQYIEREGHEIEQTRSIKAYSMLYSSTVILNNQLTGEHELSSRGNLLKWSVANSYVWKNTPSYRRMTYLKNDDADISDPYIAYIPIGFPSPNYAGRFYSSQSEQFTTGRIDLNIPLNEEKSNYLKFGLSSDFKNRSFDARVFGYTYAKNNIPLELLTQELSVLFDPKNINENGFVLKESTNPNDSYTASGTGLSAYSMWDQAFFGQKLRIITGLRLESFNQKLSSFEYGGREIKINENYIDYLPSLNAVYKLNEKSNLRFSATRTIIRPNFRELAPFSFYDFNLAAAVVGNPELKRTQVSNLDLKFEKFFLGGQSVSFAAFYKNFKNPVEQIYETLGAGTKNFNFENAKSATNYGLEAEIRYNLNQLLPKLDGLQFRSNIAWIYSKVDLSDFAGQNNSKRALQSQSPYLINLALNYQLTKSGLDLSILYNAIGRRIWLVGSNGYQDTYESPRNLLDLQVSKKLGKYVQLKLAISDILNEPYSFYQDQNKSGKFDADDTLIMQNKSGINYSLTLNLMIK